MIFLRRIELTGDPDRGHFPFDVPALRDFTRLEFNSPVTFFVGENGTGKSTLLEAIALRARLPCATGLPLEHEPTLAGVHPLAHCLRLGWMPRTKSGFFLRVEDFFSIARETKQRAEAMGVYAERFIDEPRATSYLPSQRHAVEERNGEDLHVLSHGESFLKFVQSRCTAGGLHIIDEPEAALSPQRQLAFMSIIKQLVADDAQFIIATHSPLLLAFPGAQIVSFDEKAPQNVNFEELPHVTLTRNFLSDPERFLREL
ncbi:MAG TPA: AAA family ATPase [Opitutaceae bacterium]